MITVGEKIRAAREAKGLSQEQLAALANVSQTTIDKIERNVTKRSRLLHLIANALSIGMRDLDPDVYGYDMIKPGEEIDKFIAKDNNSSEDSMLRLYSAELIGKDEFRELRTDLPLLEISATPIDFVRRPNFLIGSPDAYSIYISNMLMHPEFDVGDMIFINPHIPFIDNTTLVFLSHKLPNHRIIGRLISHTPDEWEVKHWSGNQSFKLQRSEWPRLNRVVAKYYRR